MYFPLLCFGTQLQLFSLLSPPFVLAAFPEYCALCAPPDLVCFLLCSRIARSIHLTWKKKKMLFCLRQFLITLQHLIRCIANTYCEKARMHTLTRLQCGARCARASGVGVKRVAQKALAFPAALSLRRDVSVSSEGEGTASAPTCFKDVCTLWRTLLIFLCAIFSRSAFISATRSLSDA